MLALPKRMGRFKRSYNSGTTSIEERVYIKTISNCNNVLIATTEELIIQQNLFCLEC
jgi:hypothetical protein